MQDNAAWIIFGATYLALAVGYVPWIRLDRTGAAFVGSVAMLAFGVVSLERAFLAQDYRTLVLLFSMMLVVSFLVNSGLLARLERRALDRLETRRRLFWGTLILSAAASALFVNDIVCMVLTPLVLRAAVNRKLNPTPFLLATAMASNIGSLATPVGNPQNIFIASASGISYASFVVGLAPVALVGVGVCGLWIELLYRGDWQLKTVLEIEPEDADTGPPPPTYASIRAGLVVLGILVGFWAGCPLATVGAAGAALLLLTRRVSRERIFALVDWDLLVLFTSLFVLIAGAREAGIINTVAHWLQLDPGRPFSLATVTLVLSNLFSNVPAVLFLGQILPSLARPQPTFLLLAMISTLAGNLTLIGSIANLIVAEKARPAVKLDFWTYLRAGLPVCLSTVALGLGYWWIRFG